MKWRLILLGVVAVLFGLWVIVLWKIAPNSTTALDAFQAIRTVPAKWLTWKEVASYPLPSSRVNGIAVDGKGRIYAACDKGLLIFTRQDQQPVVIPIPKPPMCVALRDDKIYMGVGNHIEVLSQYAKQIVKWAPPAFNAQMINLAVNNSYVYAADAGNKFVWKYDIQGKLVGTIGRSDSAKDIKGFILPSPHFDIAIQSDGDLYVNNPGLHKVERFTPNGRLISSFGGGGNSIAEFCGCCNPIRIALLPSGDIVTSEKGLPRVKVFKPNGSLDSVIAGPGDFSQNTDDIPIATDAQGKVYIANNYAKQLNVYARDN
jgi:hypothetical protein